MSGGITKDRFFNLVDDYFDCVICQQVVISPKICTTCSNLFCKSCIVEWQKKKPSCPFKCNNSGTMIIGDIPASIKNLYEDLQVMCSRENCQEVLRLKDLMIHEMNCGVAKCFNFQKCGNTAPYTIKDKPVCSEACYIVQVLTENVNISNQELLKYLENFVDKVKQYGDSNQNAMKLSWLTNSEDISINDNIISNKEKVGGLYQSAVTDQGFVGGIHYFEVEIPASNKYAIKVGVTLNKNFEMKENSFSDFATGYGFFSKGQLRNNSDSMGLKYGKEVKGVASTIGVIVNQSKGQLGFTIDGDYQGVAYEAPALMNGPVYPAVSLRGGCMASLVYGKELPNEAFFMEI